MSSTLAVDVLTRLLAHPELAKTLRLQQVLRFLEFTRRIWPEIIGHASAPPIVLPVNTATFLASVLSLPLDNITLAWLAFRDIATTFEQETEEPSLDDRFRLHTDHHRIGAEPLVPPVTRCPRSGCDERTLGETVTVEARLYTLHRGVLPVFSKSLYCRSCNTRYYPNYFVKDASQPDPRREYYDFYIPQKIHVTETSFFERELCVYFEMQMAMTHSSAEGISRIYNLALGQSTIPNASRLAHQLDGDLVLDAFFHHAVLRDKSFRHQTLSVPHSGPQRHRLDEALQERNYNMAGTGQEFWAHTCNRCMKLYQGEDGNWYQLTARVHDGVTVRHLACSVHDCTEPLPHQKARFCTVHSHLKDVCYIKGCDEITQSGFATCTLESHRAHELASRERHAAMFQLHARLQNTGITQVSRAGAAPVPQSMGQTSAPAPSLPAPATGPTNTAAAAPTPAPTVKGSNSRHWTHNEQLFVRCCGVIISRATFFGSEGITGVSVFLKATFPPQYPGAMPSYIFYDNNCSFVKHLLASGDHYFDRVGLPVDVWHFKCKHKEGDLFCQTHCNPARFRELVGEDGTWVFNSSAAEQSNAWFGKFQNVVQEMPVLRYNFFLDEMISIHNRHVVAELARKGERPHMIPDHVLRGSGVYEAQSSI